MTERLRTKIKLAVGFMAAATLVGGVVDSKAHEIDLEAAAETAYPKFTIPSGYLSPEQYLAYVDYIKHQDQNRLAKKENLKLQEKNRIILDEWLQDLGGMVLFGVVGMSFGDRYIWGRKHEKTQQETPALVTVPPIISDSAIYPGVRDFINSLQEIDDIEEVN